VNDRVHPAEIIDLVGKAPSLPLARQVSDDNICAKIGEVSEACRALRIARMHDNLVTMLDQGRRR
jgi:hypothetical protein